MRIASGWRRCSNCAVKMGCDMGFDPIHGLELLCKMVVLVRDASLQVCNMLRGSRLLSQPG